MENMEATDIIAKILEYNGVKDAVVSSGSRSLRMVRAVDDNPAITVRMVVDERVAAFMTLGISDATQRPVALVCTSGTAMLNYAPAIAEAYYRGVPIVVITADRPPEMIDINDGQTIRQFHALDNIVKMSIDIDATRHCCKEDFDEVWSAVNASVSPRKGPVHINLHLPEGLTPSVLYSADCYNAPEYCNCNATDFMMQGDGLKDKKILVFIGQRYHDSDFDAEIERLAKCPNVEILADIVSNCHAEGVINDIDTLMREKNLHGSDLCPDILITFGKTSPLSRRFKEWLRNAGDYSHWRVTDKEAPEDTYYHLSRTIVTDDTAFLRWLNGNIGGASAAPAERPWRLLHEIVEEKKRSVLSRIHWGDMCAIHTIAGFLPERCAVISSNGMSIRNLSVCLSGRRLFICNRGVNGIDGSTSTALGYSLASDKLTVLVSGDMSAIYDISALYSGYLSPRFKMIIIANGGGEIFRAIPATSSYDARERLLCNIPDINWSYVARSVGMDYFEASSKNELEKLLPGFFVQNENAGMLVVNTPPGNSGMFEAALKEYESNIENQ